MFGDLINFDLDGFADIHPYFPTHIDLNLRGTLLNDVLTGSDGQDFLNGGPGNDLLIGGEGGDAYVLDSLGDIVQEDGSNDPEDDPEDVRDSIIAAFSVNLTLDAVKYANIEDVRVIGDADMVIVGNEGMNRLTGDDGNDTLIGLGEGDDLYGRGGDDIMEGGEGGDWYYFGIGDGFDRIRDSEGEDDQLNLVGDLDSLTDLRIAGSGNDLVITLLATGEQLVIENWLFEGRIENIVFYPAEVVVMTEADILRAVSNRGPAAGNDALTVTEDSAPTSGSVLGNDTDPNSDPLAITSTGVFQGTYGSVQFFANGTYAYTLKASAQALAAGATVQDTFSYTVSDMVMGNAFSATANLVVTVNGRNDGPVTVADTGNVSEDGVLTALGNVLANDSDIDTGALLQVAAPGTRTGTYGTLTLGSSGTYTYTLNNSAAAVQGLRAGQTASDVFTYAATDGTAQTNSTLTISVAGANDAAVVSAPIADQSVTAGTAFSFAFAANTFTDPEGDALSYSARLADGSALPSWLAFNAATRTFSGTPVAGAGTLQVRVTATDPTGAAVADQFALSVQGGGGNSSVGDLVVGTRGNDVLTGTAFGDVIDGREGVDRMSGGKGDDFYFVDSTRVNGNNVVDTVVELANEGYDTVFADSDYTLVANVEELRLLGDDDLDGTGNTLNNVLVGNEGDNVLSGGAGSDTYVYELHGGDDVIDEKGTANQTDTLRLEGMSAGTVRLKQSGNNLVIDFPGRDGTVTIKNWFSSSASRVEKFVFDDGSVWDETAIRARVGKKVNAVKDDDDHGCGSDRNDCDYRGNSCDDDRRYGRDDDCDDRDGRGNNSSDEAILNRLNAPVRFSFDAITRALGKPSGSLSAGQIAERWAAVRGYTDGLCAGDSHHDSAEFPSMSKLLGLTGQGSNCFGFEGSTGSNHGSNDFRCFQGLGEGFRKL